MATEPVYSSKVGPVFDVAHRSSLRGYYKGVRNAVLGVIFGVVGLGSLGGAVLFFVHSKFGETVVALVLGGAFTPAAWAALASGIDYFRITSDSRWYFRVGTGGISICVPMPLQVFREIAAKAWSCKEFRVVRVGEPVAARFPALFEAFASNFRKSATA